MWSPLTLAKRKSAQWGRSGRPRDALCHVSPPDRSAPSLLQPRLNREPPMPQMLVLSPVEGINPVRPPSARRGRLTQVATQVLLVVPASLEPPVPKMVILAAVEGVHPVWSPGAGRGRRDQDATQVLLVVPASLEPPVPKMVILAMVENVHPTWSPGAGRGSR